jgi:hypothetical protein
MVERRIWPGDASGKDDPLCPVCLAPIKPSDLVAGIGDEMMHEACAHARRRPDALTRPPDRR